MADCFQNCELRPFIKTPSPYATSFRLDVTPVGDIISAGLLHSERPEDELDIIMLDRWDDLLTEDEEIRFLKQRFENPESPYFLHARDIRSNAALSKVPNIIPLVGIGRLLELPRHQAAILDAYDIDPDNRGIPETVRAAAKKIGRIFGPELDLVIGVDVIVDATTRRIYVNDINANSGTQMFAKCHPTEGGNARVRMRRLALSQIARQVNGGLRP